MTDITDEQRAAVEWLHEIEAKTNGQNVRNHVRLLLDALPSELTNPQPVLPEDHGEYHDVTGHLWWLDSGGWHNVNGPHPDAGAQRFAPFTRLVPERPQITRGQVAEAVGPHADPWKASRAVDAVFKLIKDNDR